MIDPTGSLVEQVVAIAAESHRLACTECAAKVRAMAERELAVGKTWTEESAGSGDPEHLRNCAAIGRAHHGFAGRLEELATEIEARSEG